MLLVVLRTLYAKNRHFDANFKRSYDYA